MVVNRLLRQRTSSESPCRRSFIALRVMPATNSANSYKTIAAIATASGMAGIGIIRLSGPDALSIASQLFQNHSLQDQQHARLHLARMVNQDGSLLDEVLVAVFRAPHSYTGEDLVEINAHGSSFILTEILHRLLGAGAEPAQPGEFTQRAFLNGKMDLSQAEAVADLIHSTNAVQHRYAINQLKGGIRDQIAGLRHKLVDFASLIELELDFSEEDVEFANRDHLLVLLKEIQQKINQLLNSFELGEAVRHGIYTVIAGKPNAGKSTLLNALLGEERAIVSDIPGTTRDTIEEQLNINGIVFRLVDTAGIRATDDVIEASGVQRTLRSIALSSILIYVADVGEANTESLENELASVVQEGQEVVLIANKSDLHPGLRLSKLANSLVRPENIIPLSALHGTGLDTLRNKLFELASHRHSLQEFSVLINARHRAILGRAREALQAVEAGLLSGLQTDLVAQSLRQGIYELGQVSGEVSSDELLGNIFGKFCIGK